jgi:glucose/arabinose dehydrogenase
MEFARSRATHSSKGTAGRRLQRGVVALLFAGATVTATVAGAGGAIALPTGFTDTQLADSTTNPLSGLTAIVPLLNTGRALVLERGGAVRLLGADGTLLDDDVLDLSLCSTGEMGLLGAAVDPGFATNGFVYLFYTNDALNCASSNGRFNRVSRFTMSGDTIDPASELILLDNMNIPAGNHNAGDLHIGNDGDLYVTVGDGGVNPRGTGTAGSAAQDLSLFNGKVLRITTTGGVPSDNPFVGVTGAQSCAKAGISAPTTAVCTEIYAYGLRNPFRFAFDPNTSGTRFFINDVGQSLWEEVDNGGSGLNYGWDVREGYCANGSTTDCAPTPAGYTDPLTVYNHSIGCTYITAGAFVPNDVWPSGYNGDYLFADGGCGKIFLMTSGGTVDYDNPFAQTSGVIVYMAFLTQGGQTALYYVTNSTGQIHKIAFTAAPPVTPHISVTNVVAPTSVVAPGGSVTHTVKVTDTGTSSVTVASLQDSLYGDLTTAPASTCVTGGPLTATTSYSCSFAAGVSGTSGSVADTVTAEAKDASAVSATATATATVQVTAPVRHCTIADIKGLLASTARTDIVANHCTVHQIVVAMKNGSPVVSKGAFVTASTTAAPKTSPGSGKTWTLRVEWVALKPGTTRTAGSWETFWAGWEATPNAIAHNSGARYL